MIQPLDGGILETLKRTYRKLLLERVLASNTEENSPTLLEAIRRINLKDVTYMVGEAWDQAKPNSIAKVWRKTLLNRVYALRQDLEPNGTSTTNTGSEADFTNESEGFNNESEADAVIISEGLRETGFEINIAEAREWLTVDKYEQGHSTMTDEEILYVVCNPVEEDNDEVDNTTDEPVTSSHSEAFECFSKCILWLEAQPDSDPVSVQLLRRLQQNTANKRETALKQQ